MENEILKFIIENKFVILVIFVIVEKIVKLTPSKKDDVIFDIVLKPIFSAVKNMIDNVTAPKKRRLP